MFLEITKEKNPELLELAVYYHQKGIISPNTYLIDLDTVRKNAEKLAQEAKRQQIELYFMTKQVGRNPLLARAIVEAGITKAVAVDPWEAKKLADHGITLGHIGHLVQIPLNMISTMLQLQPEVITVFSYDHAKAVSDEAMRLGVCQKLLLRVVTEQDFLYPGQTGGILLTELEREVERIKCLPGVEIGGVTSFPCLIVEQGEARPTANFTTLQAASKLLRDQGLDDLQINAPSVGTSSTLSLIKSMGGTHTEPGHALTGTTPLHACANQPERPAMVYVSEVSHHFAGNSYVYGGGFYNRSQVKNALVGRSVERLRKVAVMMDEPSSIDYYGTLLSDQVTVGETAVFAFRTQVFVTRSEVAVVEGIGTSPRICGRFDSRGNLL